jgi:hypothetical protein
MRKSFGITVAGVAGLLLVGACASTTGVRAYGPDSYTITVENGSFGKVRGRALQHAGRFCMREAKMVETIDEKFLKTGPGEGYGAVTLNFRCVTRTQGSEAPANTTPPASESKS